jgi:hypothetical protein
MEPDEKDAIRGHLSVLDVECAIVDGINMYLRDVLEPRGICDPEKDQDFAGSEQNALKYQIAEKVALAWVRSRGGSS